jgi:hypothetical protein
MKNETPWSSIVGFLLLVALGIGIPFWLEYKSLANPPNTAVHAARTDDRPAIDVRKGTYCGNCAESISLPEWNGGLEGRGGHASPLSLKTLGRAKWETPQSSTRAGPLPGIEAADDR